MSLVPLPSGAGRSLRSIVRPARVDARRYALRASCARARGRATRGRAVRACGPVPLPYGSGAMSQTGLVWPVYVAIEADGYAVADDTDVERTPFEDGLVRQERRYASALTALDVRVLIAGDDDYGRFRAWARDCAHRWFAWTAPETGAQHQVRVRGGAGGIEYTARVGGDGRRAWEATLTLEGVGL